MIGIQHPACPMIHILFGFLSLNTGFMDSLAVDHSILCLKLIALWSLKGKISALLKAVFLTWASLPWVGSEGNLVGSSPGKAKPLHLSLCWKLLFMLSGRLYSTLAWKEQDRVSWGQVRTPPARTGCLYLIRHTQPQRRFAGRDELQRCQGAGWLPHPTPLLMPGVCIAPGLNCALTLKHLGLVLIAGTEGTASLGESKARG